MAKFGGLYHHLLQERVIEPTQVYQPGAPPLEWLTLVHGVGYVTAYCQGHLEAKAQRRIGLPWSPDLVQRTCAVVGGTILTAKLALRHGLACNTAGGTHHAFPDYGTGFCIFNDLAVAARVLLQQALVQQVLIIDLDVHQGDGTAWIFNQDPRVFTFSMHCAVNFPGTKQLSDLDVPLPAGMQDDAYLKTLMDYLPSLLQQVNPDLVLYDAGVDTHQADRLGKLAMSDAGIYRRDHCVLKTCARAGYPVACVIGGGYGDDMEALIWRHSLVHRAATAVFRELI
ncbi:Acetoin utilization protein AcuC [Halomicronema hongdechloris C2206]|uniref:Acetoin utilization protein AcuC n=2 Tax=Halomicronema hongdechloris TaxID=1209493 RepID=A0A1Z3HNH4_9CYAN|nr:Acetoin utilization protein AcuC [Halomicronema hongdechloris C2206]